MRNRSAGIATLVLTIASVGCASDPAPFPVAPTQTSAALPPVPGSPQPTWLRIPNAHASLDAPPRSASTDWKIAFRSQGANAVVTGTTDGLLVVSKDRGVEGFVKTPAEWGSVRWAGFGKNDAMLFLAGTKLHRAASIADALAGKFSDLPASIDPALTLFASAGDCFVAGSPSGAYFESNDGGATLKARSLPAKGPLTQLVVRDDGLVLAAFRTGERPGKYGGTTIHAQTYVERKNAWKKSALVESSEEPVTLTGDVVEALRIKDDGKFEDDSQMTFGALDAKGTWLESSWIAPWLQTWPSQTFAPSPSLKRPKMPSASKGDGSDLGLLAGFSGMRKAECVGVACLENRIGRSPPPTAYALDDAECADSSVTQRADNVLDANGKKTETVYTPVCDDAKPASRTAAIVIPNANGNAIVRLPSWCASGEVTGTDSWPMIRCNASHGGTSALATIDASAGFPILAHLVEKSSSPFEGGTPVHVERSNDGTTVLNAENVYVCTPSTHTCAPIAKSSEILTAIPIDGGRALVARQGATPQDLSLSLAGARSAKLVDLRVSENLLDLSITSDGCLRLVTHPKEHRLEATAEGKRVRGLHVWLVRTDASLVPSDDATLARP